jgi:hypothetical protein
MKECDAISNMLLKSENRETGKVMGRLQRALRGGLQALMFFFTIAQSAAPLLHAHFSDGSAGVSGVHIHFGMSVTGNHAFSSELRDLEARILSAPDAYFRDEVLRVLETPALVEALISIRSTPQASARAGFASIPTRAPQPFPKPLPLAPPASA